MDKKSGKIDIAKLVGIEITYWLAAAFGSFMVVFLQEQNMSASRIGMINAINSAVVIVSVPIWGIIGDKLRSIKKVYLITIFASLVLFPMIALSSHLPVGAQIMITIMVIASFFFRTPAQNLLDSFVVEMSNVKRLNYGSIRASGSLAFAVSGIVLGLVITYIGVENTFYIFPLLLIPNVLIGLSVKEAGTGPAKPLSLKELHFGELFKNYYYVTFLLFILVYNFALSNAYTFLPYMLEHVGVEGSRYGIITGYRALIEAPVLILMIRLRKRIPMQYLMVISMLFYGIEPLLLAGSSSLWQMVIFTSMYGIGSGLFVGSAMNYCFQLAPDQLKATAMTCYAAVGSIAGILGNLLGGILLDQYGVVSLFVVDGIVFFIAAMIYGVTLLIGSRVLKLRQPGVSAPEE